MRAVMWAISASVLALALGAGIASAAPRPPKNVDQILGRVHSHGRPVGVGWHVRLSQGQKVINTAKTNSNGTFYFTRVPAPATYQLAAEAPGGKTWCGSQTLKLALHKEARPTISCR